ncbi:hypothetical protein [Flavobacterium sharifuzzamanii]|uniref:hypothetical protein n=1 Tax=Flavobacterium sharifuzzamanii TaxID=2211133 RepID=UPI000DAE7118|nr:hypothetical protein [Flavobacterium sharifuzzamanii]KAF2082703.1 hypothetical protein DMA14_02070 [Flavobacterium sharifuzzamanii]
MEPNNFEKDFREKLNQREIEPSNNAWDRLDAMLSVAEEKKPKKNRKWLYIAASIAGFLLVGTIYLNRSETVEIKRDTPIVLEQKINKDTSDVVGINKDDTISINNHNLKPITKNVQAVVEIRNQNKNSKQLENNVALSVKNDLKEDNVADNSLENKNPRFENKSKYISAEQLLAEVNGKVETKSADEVIKKNRKAVSVNPNDLLLNAETELNQSYRESALDKFNKNLKAVKSAIANRNYEE